MRYAKTRYNMYQREIAYRYYISSCLRIMTENTAKTVGCVSQEQVEAQYLTTNLVDLFSKKCEEEQEKKPVFSSERLLKKLRGEEITD